MVRAMSKAEIIMPDAPILIRSRRPAPTRAKCTKVSPSRSGMPIWSMNSDGAAPVPPSLPSTTMKSGVMPVFSMALTMARNSCFWPMHSFMPTGLPPESSRSCVMKAISSSGVEKAGCAAGETQSRPIGTPRIRETSSVIFAAGSTPPWPGFAPWESLISIILICGSVAVLTKFSGEK